MRRLAVMVALLALFGGDAVAKGGPQPLDFSTGGGFVQSPRFSPVEQQSDYDGCCTPVNPVVNPYAAQGCFWDINEHFYRMTTGYLDAGASTSWGYCVVWEPNSVYRTISGQSGWWSTQAHSTGVEVWAPDPGLSVTVCYSSPARCFAADPPVWSTGRKEWHYLACSQAVYVGNPLDPAVQEIPGSNGGVGVLSQMTATVANGTGRRVRGVQATVGLSSDLISEAGCATVTSLHSEYPFNWWS